MKSRVINLFQPGWWKQRVECFPHVLGIVGNDWLVDSSGAVICWQFALFLHIHTVDFQLPSVSRVTRQTRFQNKIYQTGPNSFLECSNIQVHGPPILPAPPQPTHQLIKKLYIAVKDAAAQHLTLTRSRCFGGPLVSEAPTNMWLLLMHHLHMCAEWKIWCIVSEPQFR